MQPPYERHAALTSFDSVISSTAHDRIPAPPDEMISELVKILPSAAPGTEAMIVSALAMMQGGYQPIRTALPNLLPFNPRESLLITNVVEEFVAFAAVPAHPAPAPLRPLPAVHNYILGVGPAPVPRNAPNSLEAPRD
jgi:hypothetical protein